MKIARLGRAALAQAGNKIRQPLSHVVVSVAGSSEEGSLERIKPQIMEELNVKDLITKHFREVAELEGKGYVVISSQERTFSKKGIAQFTTGVYLVAIPTEISPELQAEGMAREVVHRLQTMRRSAGFDIADYIITYYEGDAYVRQIMENENLADYIRQETLSEELVSGVPSEGVFTESHKLGDHDILLGVRRL